MGVGDIRKNVSAQAMSFPVTILHPNVADRRTLEQEEEKINSAEEHDDREVRVDNADLVFLAREAEEVDTNGKFCDCSCDHIEEFADENVLVKVSI
jgi:hypothetical protein